MFGAWPFLVGGVICLLRGRNVQGMRGPANSYVSFSLSPVTRRLFIMTLWLRSNAI